MSGEQMPGLPASVIEDARSRAQLVKPVKGIATLDAAEREHILRTVDLCAGNLTMVAEVLEISRSTLYRKVRRYRREDKEKAKAKAK